MVLSLALAELVISGQELLLLLADAVTRHLLIAIGGGKRALIMASWSIGEADISKPTRRSPFRANFFFLA